MIKVLGKVLVLAAVVTLAACGGSTGNTKLAKLNDAEVERLIIPGKTTSSEIRAQLGEPTDIDFDNHGNKKWIYAHTKSSLKATNYIPVVGLISGGTNDLTKKLVIIFDKNDRVKDHVVTQSKGETKTGLVH